MQLRLARIHVRRHNGDSANAQQHLIAALAAFSEAMKSVVVASKAVHYLEVCHGPADLKYFVWYHQPLDTQSWVRTEYS